jgi:hypothetical protein
MAKYLISFPASAMAHVAGEDLAQAGEDSHAVVRAAKAAGAWVFGGGIDSTVPSVLVAGDGSTSNATTQLDGGFCVLELPDRDAALAWAAKLAAACRCPQEVREFMYDPES